MIRSLLLALALPFLLVACQSGASAPEPAPPERYVFAFLLAGPAREANAQRASELQAGHMANIQRLAAERKLLVAGPFGDPRPDPRRRGIFVFDVASVEEAEELCATDPAIAAGSLAVDAYAWSSTAPLRTLPDRYEAHERARRAADPNAPQFEGRGYVLVLAADAEVAERGLASLAARGLVLFSGRFEGERAGQALYCLDALDLARAKELIAEAQAASGVELECELLPWWATSVLVQLAQPAVDLSAGLLGG